MTNNNEHKIIALKYDFMFCQIFNNKENIFILEEFIADYFGYDLEDVIGNIEIINRKLKRVSDKEPSKEVDLLLKYKGEIRNIEISTNWSEGVIDRNIIYLSKLHGEQEYSNYDNIKQTIQINLLAFNYRNKLKSSYYMADTSDKNNIHIISKKIKMDVISMAIGKNMCYTDDVETDKIIKWSKIFMSETKEELEENLKQLKKQSQDKLLSEVLHLSGDKDMLKKYEEKSKLQLEHESWMHDFNKYKEKWELEHESWMHDFNKKKEKMELEHESWVNDFNKKKEKWELEHESWMHDFNKKKEKLEEKETTLEEKKQELDTKSQELDTKSQELDTKSQELDTKSQELDTKSQELDTKIQELDNKSKELKDKEEQLNDLIDNKAKEKSIEIAKKMLEEKIDIDIIVKVTSLSINDILKINQLIN